MERFLQYSLERNRAIRLIYMDEEAKLRQVTAVITAYDQRQVSMHVLRPPSNVTVNRADILSTDYRKGDEGGE